jgi:RNA polymerase sigma-70 factor
LGEVFGEVLRALPEEERNMLSLRYLDRLSTDGIAELLGLDGSTVRRRMIKLRERVLADTRARLAERLHLGETECNSLIQAVRSQIGLSVAKFLR